MKYIKYRNFLMLFALLAFAAFMAQTSRAQAAATAKLPAGWTGLKPATSVFSISVPVKATVETQKLGAAAGNMTATYYTSQGPHAFAMIADLYDLPVRADTFDQKATTEIFDGFRSGLVKGFQSSLEKQGIKIEVRFDEPANVTYQGLKGIDQNVTVGMFKARTRMLLAKEHIFMFFVMAMPGAEEGTTDTVINSFKYLGK